ncbi:Hypothetical_protein [Hexamita inflata]|uniref:Hypothetical_protein n=1 Tax=Hexamita inflata TaxID=28002 RepID=A0AA86PM79_9EUKA|nr:Hypothetical protein HINF_LOCUS25675 [Hexamita inflata]
MQSAHGHIQNQLKIMRNQPKFAKLSELELIGKIEQSFWNKLAKIEKKTKEELIQYATGTIEIDPLATKKKAAAQQEQEKNEPTQANSIQVVAKVAPVQIDANNQIKEKPVSSLCEKVKIAFTVNDKYVHDIQRILSEVYDVVDLQVLK